MHKRRIYVASSWRNTMQFAVVDALRREGHEVYDFKNPPARTGFSWSQCHDELTKAFDERTVDGYLIAMQTDVAKAGFASDKAALDWCDTCILVLPCGRSAHLEAGYTAGQGKDTYFLLNPDKFEPELMYALGTAATPSLYQIIEWMDARESGDAVRWHEENDAFCANDNLAPHALRALREMIELCFASKASSSAISDAFQAEFQKEAHRPSDRTPAAVREEWADVAILLEVFRNYANIDQHAVMRTKLDILWQRQWKVDADGVLWRP